MINNHIKGKEYEIQTREYIINTLNVKAYLWEDTPETILVNSGIIGSHNINRLIRKEKKENPLMDTGIDVIQVNEDETVSLVQCKNGYKNGITMHDLSGFMCWMTVLDKLNGYVYYTDKISNNLKYLPENKRLGFIKYKYAEKKDEVLNDIVIIPFDYQIEAKNKITKYLEKNNRSILSMPCGTGKTLTSYLISQQYKQIIILSPLKQFAKQNLDCFIKYGFKGNSLLVDSDGERDIDEIKKFIENNENFIISATFFSIDVLYDLLKYTKNLLIIVDEFHNLSKNNVSNEDDNFYKILSQEYKILFVSATPRVYEMENEDDNYMDMFGEIVYKMEFSKAIENKYICDYKIWLPSIHEDNSDLNEELTIYEIDDVIKSKCNFLYSCLLNNGSKKIIIYCVDTEEIKEMIKAFDMLNEFYCLEYDIQKITSKNSEKKRTEILKNFSDNEKIQLLFSVRILDECIDIPKCDSIYITYPSQSKIRTIQRICRCLRIDKTNKFKIGNIYIWCSEYDKILETLGGIKEYDIFFKDKIKINEVNFKGKGEKVNIEVDKKCVEKYVMGIKEFKFVSWGEKLEMVKKYMDKNNKRPSTIDKNNEIKIMGGWFFRQINNYKKKEQIMSNQQIYNEWEQFTNDEKYKKYFISNDEEWYDNLNKVKKYIYMKIIKDQVRQIKTMILNVLGCGFHIKKHFTKKKNS
jgi:superfamily II DNA or RNA helicase